MVEKIITNNLVKSSNATKTDPSDNSSTISNLPNAGNLAQNDLLPIVRSGTNFKATYVPIPATTVTSDSSINVANTGSNYAVSTSGDIIPYVAGGGQSIKQTVDSINALVAQANTNIATLQAEAITQVNISGGNVTGSGNIQNNTLTLDLTAPGGGSGIQQITSPTGSLNIGGNTSNTTVDANFDNKTINQNNNKQLQVNPANLVDNNTINLNAGNTAQVNLPNIVDNKTITVQNNKLVATAAAPSYTSNTLTIDNTQNTINLAINSTLNANSG